MRQLLLVDVEFGGEAAGGAASSGGAEGSSPKSRGSRADRGFQAAPEAVSGAWAGPPVLGARRGRPYTARPRDTGRRGAGARRAGDVAQRVVGDLLLEAGEPLGVVRERAARAIGPVCPAVPSVGRGGSVRGPSRVGRWRTMGACWK